MKGVISILIALERGSQCARGDSYENKRGTLGRCVGCWSGGGVYHPFKTIERGSRCRSKVAWGAAAVLGVKMRLNFNFFQIFFL